MDCANGASMQTEWKEEEQVTVDTQGRMESGAQWKEQGWTPRGQRGEEGDGEQRSRLISGVPNGSMVTQLGPVSVWRKRDGKGMASSGSRVMADSVDLKWRVKAETFI